MSDSDSTRCVADFPAWCIPALAAFQGSEGFAPPDPQVNLAGARIETHANEGMVRLVSTDGHNLLCLNAPGRFNGLSFVFSIPDELVKLCTPPPRVRMWAEGSEVEVKPPGWQMPDRVLLMGYRYGDGDRNFDELLAFVSPQEAHPDSEDLGLGGVNLRFLDHSRVAVVPLDKLAAEPGDSLPERAEIAAQGLHKLGKLVEAMVPECPTPTLSFGRSRQVWKFGDSWVVTMTPDPEAERTRRMAAEGITEEDVADARPDCDPLT